MCTRVFSHVHGSSIRVPHRGMLSNRPGERCDRAATGADTLDAMSQPPWPGPYGEPPVYPPPGWPVQPQPQPLPAGKRSAPQRTTITVISSHPLDRRCVIATTRTARRRWPRTSLFDADRHPPRDLRTDPARRPGLSDDVRLDRRRPEAPGSSGASPWCSSRAAGCGCGPCCSIVCTVVGFLSGPDLTIKSTEWTGRSSGEPAPHSRYTPWV